MERRVSDTFVWSKWMLKTGSRNFRLELLWLKSAFPSLYCVNLIGSIWLYWTLLDQISPDNSVKCLSLSGGFVLQFWWLDETEDVLRPKTVALSTGSLLSLSMCMFPCSGGLHSQIVSLCLVCWEPCWFPLLYYDIWANLFQLHIFAESGF